MLDAVLQFITIVAPLAISVLSMIVAKKMAKGEPHTVFWTIIIFCGLLGTVIAAVQSYRSIDAQHTLQSQLDKIQHNTEQPAKVDIHMPEKKERSWVNINWSWASGPPIETGKMLAINLWYKNNGDLARSFGTYALAFERDHRLDQREEDGEYSKFLAKARKSTIPRNALAPGANVFQTLPRLVPFTAEEVSKIQATKLWTYFFALARYTDAQGPHETEFCVVHSGTGAMAVNCISHNGPTF